MMHKGQTHANNVPVWHHLLRVSKRLEVVLNETKEGTPKERKNIVLSALGHDLLEDTKAEKKEIEKIFGSTGLQLILGMTNELGDSDVKPYVQKMKNSPEEVRLIKLADLCDNLTSVGHNMAVLGKKWTEEYFLPIVTPMRAMILKSKFDKYYKTSETLKIIMETAWSVLQEEVKGYKK